MSNTTHTETTKNAPSQLKTDSLAAGLSLLLILTVGQRFIGFGRNLLFCRWLEPAELGRWNLAFSLLLLAAPMIVLGLPGSFGRYVEHYRHKGQLKSFLKRTSLLTIALAIAGILGLVTFHRTAAWAFFGSEDFTFLLFASVGCLFSVVTFNFLIELFTALRQLRVVSYMQVTNSLSLAGFSLGLLIFWQPTAISIIAGYGLACLVTALGSTVALYRVWNRLEDSGPSMPQSSLWWKILPFAGWIWFSDLLLNLFTAADRYMIVHFSKLSNEKSAELIGQYHSSLIIPVLLLSISHMVASVIMPYLTNDWERGKSASVNRHINGALQVYGFVAFCAGVAVLLFSPIIFGWALQGKYTDGLSVLPWTLGFAVWAGLMNLSTCYLRCAEKAGVATVGPVFGLIANVGLNLLLLPWLGLMGAVLATAIGNLIAYQLCVFFCSRYGFMPEKGTIWIAVLPFLLPMGLPIAMTGGLLTLWAIVRTDWVCSHENKIAIAKRISEKLPNRFAHWASSPLLALATATTSTTQ